MMTRMRKMSEILRLIASNFGQFELELYVYFGDIKTLAHALKFEY